MGIVSFCPPYKLKNAIKWSDDKKFVTVTFAGLNKTVTLSVDEILNADKDFGNSFLSKGDDDVLILELAMKKFEIWGDLSGGDQKYFWNLFIKDANIYQKLVQNDQYEKGLDVSDVDKWLNNLLNQKNSNKLLAAGFGVHTNGNGTNPISCSTVDGQVFSFDGGGHAFSIIDITKDTLTFVNPWDSSVEYTVTWDEFKKLRIYDIESAQLNENFADVRAELSKNVPDRTTTIEEKELALFYINRMLACNDIPDDAKAFWINNKAVIEEEIVTIRNQNKTGNEDSISQVYDEMHEFMAKYEQMFNSLTPEIRTIFGVTYARTVISFCERGLQCPNITPEDKANLEDRLAIFRGRMICEDFIDAISNGNNYNELLNQLNQFCEQYRNNVPEFNDIQTRIAYLETYNDMCINFYTNMMGCFDATENDKAYCKRQIDYHRRDINYGRQDLNRYMKEQGFGTESYKDVLAEMKAFVPSRTTTESEKELALSYINIMLICDDIPDNIKQYWENQKIIVQTELEQFRNKNNND